MSSSKSLVQRFTRRVQRWWALDPEFAPYLPETHTEYRYPSPASQPDAIIPRQEFMKEFHIKYYQRDYRSVATDKHAEHAHFEMLYRQDAIKNPMRLQPGQAVGPFYGFGMEKRVSYVFDERQNKQVYSYKKNLYPFRPEDSVKDEEETARREDEQTYKPQVAANK